MGTTRKYTILKKADIQKKTQDEYPQKNSSSESELICSCNNSTTEPVQNYNTL